MAAQLLGNLKARRTPEGELEIWNKGAYEKFSAQKFSQLSQHKPALDESGKRYSFESNTIAFVQKFAPHLLAEGILRREDFKILGSSSTAEIFSTHERSLKPKTPTVMFTGEAGKPVSYYIGREKITGTDYPIDSHKTKVVLLDEKLAGIVDEFHGKRELKYIFPLLNSEETEAVREQVMQKMQSEGKKLENSAIAARTVVTGPEMRRRLQEYKITSFLPKRADETPEEYAERISRLSDAGFVTGTFRSFFTEAGLGVHRLPWSEQLVLASAILQEKNPQRLLDFAKKYGMNGVRAFLSLDYDHRLGPKILNLGETLEPPLSARIFDKYAEIVDASNRIEEYVAAYYRQRGEFDQSRVAEIRDRLLRRGKDLLVYFSDSLSKPGMTEKNAIAHSTEVIDRLEHIQTEILLFASTFKTASQDNTLEFDDIRDTELVSKDSSELVETEKREMIRIFEANRPNYSDALLKETLGEF